MTYARPLVMCPLLCVAILCDGGTQAQAEDRPPRSTGRVTRDVTFELTFRNRDLTWLGDPASPAATVYIKPGAQPIATDVCVRTLVESDESPTRQYMREARVVDEGGERQVRAFTSQREKLIGTIDRIGQFVPNEFYARHGGLLPTWPSDASTLKYDPNQNALYYDVVLPGPRVSESLDFLPLDLTDAQSRAVTGRYSLDYAPSSTDDPARPAVVALNLSGAGGEAISLASAVVPRVFRREDVQLGSFDNRTGTYLPEAAYRPGRRGADEAEASVTFSIAGEFSAALRTDGESLVLSNSPQAASAPQTVPAQIEIDGRFDDWRNVSGVDDPRGDLAPYLEYVPDVDLLEFKVSHDAEHIYLYARVAGKVGRCHPDGGRSYFYAYMDVDQNPETGFLPTRDDDCYYGVDIGDDCEVQFEFVSNELRKTFYGFCGLGGDEHVLRQQVTLGKSVYGRLDERGRERAHYKAEYTYRDGRTEITEDLKLGTSDSIRVAVSPDGSEVEIVSTFAGFLKNPEGQPTVSLGQTIDLAAGMECDSKLYPGKQHWAADSTPAVRGYRLTPVERPAAARE